MTFTLTTFAWIFFRSEDMIHAIYYISSVFSSTIFDSPAIKPTSLLIIICIFIIVEWVGREEQYAFAKFGLKWPKVVRWTIYYLIIGLIMAYSDTQEKFIYFQF